MPELLVTAKALDEASAALKTLASNAENSMGQIETSVQAVDEAQKNMDASMTKLVTGFAGVATSAMNLYNAYDRVQDMTVSVDKANLAVKTSLNSVEDAQKKYNAAVEKYGADSEQAVSAAKDVELAQERYQVAVERAEMMQSNLNETMIMSAISVIPTMITLVNSVQVVTGAWTAAQNLLNIVMNANPIMLIVTAIGILITAIIAAYTYYEPFRNAVNAAGEALMNNLKPAIDWVVAGLTWLWNNVIIPVIDIFQQFWNVITNNPIQAALFGPITAITYLIQNWGTVTETLGSIWNTIMTGLNTIWNTVSGTLSSGITAFCEGVSTGWNIFTTAVSDLWNALLTGLDTGWNTLIMPVVNAVQSFMDIMSSSFTTMSDTVGGIWNALISGLMTVWNSTVGPMINSVNDFCGMVSNAFTDLYNWLVGGSEWNDMCNELTTTWDSTSDYLTSATNALIASIKSEFADLTRDLTSACYDLSSNLPPIVQTGWDEIIEGYEEMIAELQAEAEELQSELTEESIWPEMLSQMQAQTEEGLGNVVDMFSEMGEAVAGTVAAPETAPIAAGPTVVPPIGYSVSITSPLVYIEGSADEKTVNVAVEKIKEILKNVLVEASSEGAPATHKRIRTGGLINVV